MKSRDTLHNSKNSPGTRDPSGETFRSIPSTRAPVRIIGWRERVALPDLGIEMITAKIDTGARSSCLDAYDVRIVEGTDQRIVHFKVHPIQRDSRRFVNCQAPLHDQRYIRSSNGGRELRPVIRVRLGYMGDDWGIDLTLSSRDLMGFRMLLGREAIRRRFLVNAGRSFLAEVAAKREVRRKARREIKREASREPPPKG